MAVGGSWLQQPAYKGTSDQWDPKKPPVELPLYGVPPTKLMAAVTSALTALEQGYFFAPAILWDGMLRDDRIAAKSEERIDRLIGSPLEIQPAKTIKRAPKDSVTGEAKASAAPTATAQALRVAEDFERLQSRILPSSQLSKLLRNGQAMSVGIAQVLTEETEDGRVPTIRTWNNRFLRYDWLLRRYCLQTENRGEIVLERDDPEWLIYEPYGPMGWLDCAKVRSVAVPYLIRYWTRTWWARYQEVHGQPMRAGIIPATRDPKDEAIFLTQISNLAHEAVIRLPQGEEGNRFDLKLIEAASNNWMGFMKLLEHCDDSIAIAWLGQSQSTKGQGGLGSQENAGESTITRLIRKDALVRDPLRDQVIKPWAADNYGNPDLAPHLEWQLEPPEDAGEVAKADLATAQALTGFKAAGAPLNVREYMESRSLPLLTEEEHTAQKQAAVDDAQAMMVATKPALPPGQTDDKKAAAQGLDLDRLKAASDVLANMRIAQVPVNIGAIMRAALSVTDITRFKTASETLANMQIAGVTINAVEVMTAAGAEDIFAEEK